MSPGCTIRLAFFWVFLPCFCILILSLPLLGLGSKSTSLSPGFCVSRPRQYHTICWELDLFSGLFVFSWLIVWADGINKCGWCLAGGSGCWLKGLHQIPSASWIYHHSLHFHIYQIVSLVPGILCALYCYYKWWGDGWFITGCAKGDRRWVLSCSLFFFNFSCAFLLLFSCTLSLCFVWLQHDNYCISFFKARDNKALIKPW